MNEEQFNQLLEKYHELIELYKSNDEQSALYHQEFMKSFEQFTDYYKNTTEVIMQNNSINEEFYSVSAETTVTHDTIVIFLLAFIGGVLSIKSFIGGFQNE